MSDKTKFSLSKPEEEAKWLANLVSHAQKSKFYGAMNITFKDGHITEVEQSQTFRPPKELG